MKTLFILFAALTLSNSVIVRADEHKCGCDEKCAESCNKGENHECKCEHCGAKGGGHCDAKACKHKGHGHKGAKSEAAKPEASPATK